LAVCVTPRLAFSYVEAPYSLGRVLAEATQVCVLRVEKVDKERNLILYRKTQDLKGQSPDVVKHNIGRGGLRPGEWETIMAWAEPGQTAVFFNNGGQGEVCINNYWYQVGVNGDWWSMTHAEPYLLRSFYGRPEKLAPLVTAMLAGQEVITPCMVDGDKEQLQKRTAKIQRLKASLKIQDFDQKRDFVGWGGEDFRQISGMPAFSHYAGITRTDPEAGGVAPADFDGDGKIDLCLFGSGRVSLLQNNGNALNEIALPLPVGARSASWADYNGDGKPDLLLATPAGPKLFTNLGGGKFDDDSAGLPREPYYNASAAAWIDYDGDKHPDLLLANGFYGLRLYRNRGATNNQPVDATPKLGKWFFIGPFDNEGGRGFDAVYPPERNLDHAQQYVGRKDEKCTWRDGGGFADKQVNNLRHFQNNEQAVVYLHREIECPAAVELPISLGSDDGLVVWLNGEKLHSENVNRGCTPDQVKLVLPLKAGKNDLLLKISQGDGEWAFYFAPGQHQRAVPPLFEDVSDKAGLGAKGIGSDVKGDCLAVADIDGNGRSDFVYCAGTGVVALNTPQGFVLAKETGIQLTPSRLQPSFGDVNGDGKPDLLVPHANGLRLFQNQGAGKFADATGRAGALAQVTGKPGCAVFVETAPAGKWDIVVGGLGSPNRYLRNSGNGVFADATVEMGLQQRVFNTRGVSVVDLNKDGAPDMIFNNEGQESAVLLGKPLENVAAAR
jgi:hypothetical protein